MPRYTVDRLSDLTIQDRTLGYAIKDSETKKLVLQYPIEFFENEEVCKTYFDNLLIQVNLLSDLLEKFNSKVDFTDLMDSIGDFDFLTDHVSDDTLEP